MQSSQLENEERISVQETETNRKRERERERGRERDKEKERERESTEGYFFRVDLIKQARVGGLVGEWGEK